MVQIKEKHDRGVLIEGRSHQMGFAFVTQVDDGTYETVQPVSPCKDYLNDVVWSEHTGKEISVYGLKYKKTGFMKMGGHNFLTIKIMPGRGYAADKMAADVNNLKENHKTIENLLHYVEDKLKVDGRSKVEEGNDGYFLVSVPYWWCRTTNLISLYTLLIRMAQFCKTDNYEEFLETYSNTLDVSLWKSAKGNYKHFLENGPTLIDQNTLSGGHTVHNYGIIGLKLAVAQTPK